MPKVPPTRIALAYLTRGARASLVAALLWGGPAPAALAWTAAEEASARQGDIVVHEVAASEGATVQALFFVAAPLAVARAVLWDHAHYAEFLPYARRSKVLEQHGDTAVLEQVGGQGPFTVTFVTKRQLAARRISWTTLRGDVLKNEGFWELTAAPGGTKLVYQVHVVPKQAVPQKVTSFLQKQALPAMCTAVKKRIEAKANKH